MDLDVYFESRKGFGVLATADSAGVVDAAIYARPHVNDEGAVLFIMNEHKSYRNIRENPHALYLFHEEPCKDPHAFRGIRLSLEMTWETDNPAAITALRRRKSEGGVEGRHLVTFRVVETRPLVGDGDE